MKSTNIPPSFNQGPKLNSQSCRSHLFILKINPVRGQISDSTWPQLRARMLKPPRHHTIPSWDARLQTLGLWTAGWQPPQPAAARAQCRLATVGPSPRGTSTKQQPALRTTTTDMAGRKSLFCAIPGMFIAASPPCNESHLFTLVCQKRKILNCREKTRLFAGTSGCRHDPLCSSGHQKMAAVSHGFPKRPY